MTATRGPVLRAPAGNQIRIDGTLDPVREMMVRVSERGTNASPSDLNWTQKDRARDSVPCNNPDCRNGDFAIGDLLRELIQNRQDNYVGTGFCRGVLESAGAAASSRSCPTRFELEIRLHFL